MSIIEQEKCQCDDCLKIKAYFLFVHERPNQQQHFKVNVDKVEM